MFDVFPAEHGKLVSLASFLVRTSSPPLYLFLLLLLLGSIFLWLYYIIIPRSFRSVINGYILRSYANNLNWIFIKLRAKT